jgi:hypothetical protein
MRQLLENKVTEPDGRDHFLWDQIIRMLEQELDRRRSR